MTRTVELSPKILTTNPPTYYADVCTGGFVEEFIDEPNDELLQEWKSHVGLEGENFFKKFIPNLPLQISLKSSYSLYNKFLKSALSEIATHIGISPMYSAQKIEDGTFFLYVADHNRYDDEIEYYKYMIDYIYINILKPYIYNAILSTSYSMPGLFINIADDSLISYNYNWKLSFDESLYSLCKSIGTDGNSFNGLGLHHIAKKQRKDFMNKLTSHLEEVYKNLIRYGFEVVAEIKEKLSYGDRLVLNDPFKDIEKNATEALIENINQGNHEIERRIIDFMV